MSIISCQQRLFGTLDTGEAITCYSLRNTSGMMVNLLNYGATLQTIQIPDSRGAMHEITLGFNQLEDYTHSSQYPGATLAHLPPRYGNPFNQLHQAVWAAENTTHADGASVEFTLKGTMDLRYPYDKTDYEFKVRYTLTTTDELIIHTHIQTNPALPIFITHHPVWNLGGIHAGDISDHVLQVWASHYSLRDDSNFLSYQKNEIENKTAFDFREPQRIGEKRAQLPSGSEYNVCFERDLGDNEKAKRALFARVKAPVSGRTLEVYTTQPRLHFYLDIIASTQTLQGICLSPSPALQNQNTPISQIEQESCYKLIW
jgi:aldose 1-epimerase